MKFTLLLFLLFPLFVHAQHCELNALGHRIEPGTGGSAEKTTGINYIPLKFHLICNTNPPQQNWYEADTTLVDKAIDTVNARFINADIQFCKSGGVDRIYNDTFCSIDAYSLFYRFYPEFNDTTVIHVLVPVNLGSTMVAGISFQGASQTWGYSGAGNVIAIESYIMPFTGQQKYTLAHELGHYFGLYHTNNYSMNGSELVNRTNCDSTGDYCCDTPAEYGQFFADTNCMLIPGLGSVDVNGDTLTPDPRNIMCDNGWSMSCRDYFTPDQITRIKYYRQHYLSHLICAGTASAGSVNGNAEPSVSIFPNPAGLTQMLSITAGKVQEVAVLLYDISGKLIQEVYSGHSSGGTLQIGSNVSLLPAGVYYYRIMLDRQVLIRKMVKQ